MHLPVTQIPNCKETNIGMLPVPHLNSPWKIISVICLTVLSVQCWLLLGLRWGSGDNAGWLGWCELIVAHSWSRDRPDPRHHHHGWAPTLLLFILETVQICVWYSTANSLTEQANFVTIGTTLLKIQNFVAVNWKNFLFNLKRQHIVLI